jgi:hypothetical protein
MLDETVLTTMLERGELVYAKNSWLGGKNVERAKEIGITPKKRAYIRKNAPWSKARRYKHAMSLKQRVRNLLFKAALAEVKDTLGVTDPVKAARIAFGEAAPRGTVSRAKPTTALRAEIDDELRKLPPEARRLYEEGLAAIRARISAYRAGGAGG